MTRLRSLDRVTRAGYLDALTKDVRLAGDGMLLAGDLATIRDDVWAVLDHAHDARPVRAVRDALRDGRVDAPLGTMLAAAHWRPDPDAADWPALSGGVPLNFDRPAECWWGAILGGETPDAHPMVALTLVWVDAWLARWSPAARPSASADAPRLVRVAGGAR